MIIEFYGTYSAFIDVFALGALFGIIYDAFRILRISRMPYLIPQGKIYKLIKIPDKHSAKAPKAIKNFFLFSNTFLTFMEDMIFWLIVSVGEILFIYHVNGGVVRIYFIIFTFIGAALYFFTVGKITKYFSIRIIFLMRCLLYWSFYIIIYPVRLILILCRSIAKFILNITVVPLTAAIENRCNSKYSQERISRILTQSKKGFFKYD